MNVSSISVIIPTYNSANTIAKCIESIRSQSPFVPKEIIVVDGGSNDGTVDIVSSLGVKKIVVTKKNRSRQRNEGAYRTSSSWLLFIDSDMTLKSDVISACNEVIESAPNSIVAAVVPEISVGGTFWAKSRAFERSFYEGIWWIEAARLVRRDEFLTVKGYDEFLGEVGGEDGDLDTRLRQEGDITRVSGTLIYHNETNMSFKKLYSKKRKYSPTLSTSFKARNSLRSQRQLRLVPRLQVFLRKPLKIIRHPILFLGVMIIGCIEYTVLIQHRLVHRKNSMQVSEPHFPGPK